MNLPIEIVHRIEQIVATTSKDGWHVDNEAARNGGIPLMGTIGALWILRPDGTFWDSDDESGRPLKPLPSEWEHAALACGASRFAWLEPLVPTRPSDAITCATCRGRGELLVQERDANGIFCPHCFARGWNQAL